MDGIKNIVARMCAIKNEQAALKDEYASLEGELLKAAVSDLEDTKNKTVVYSSDIGTATATMAESLKITYESYLHHIFGDAYDDAVTEKTDCKLSAPAQRMMTKLWRGEYVREDFGAVIAQIQTDPKTREVLAKKLKGVNFNTDKKILMTHGGLSEENAAHYAYFLCEARVWTDFKNLMALNNADPEIVLKIINSAFVVEETPKITVTPNPED